MARNNSKKKDRSGPTDQGMPHIRKRPPPPDFTGNATKSTGADASDGDDDEQVGYGRPPRHSRFRKGQSGNPKGRPKGAKSMGTMVREVMLARMRIRTAHGPKNLSRAEMLLMKSMELASKGDQRSIDRMLRLFAEHGPQEERTENAVDVETLNQTDMAILALYESELRATRDAAEDEEDEDAENWEDDEWEDEDGSE